MGNNSSKNSQQANNETENSSTLFNRRKVNGNTKQIYDSCTMCLNSFGINEDRVPRICINTKCSRLYCAQCVSSVQTLNGNYKRFRCMYCLLEYPRDKTPMEHQILIQQLWSTMTIKYGIRYTSHLLSRQLTQNNMIDLWCDIECRRRHLVNLISTLERFARWTQAHQVMTDAHIMAEKLLDCVTRIKKYPIENLNTCQEEYKQIISTSDQDNHDGVGSHYIRICERLLVDISDAEFYRAFTNTHAKMIEWNCALVSSDQFQPQILDLLVTIEKDLNDQWLHHRHDIVRAKIGIIGYTCVGKSTILNRLLGIENLITDESSPVRSIKSTYYQLQFNRKEPLVSPANPLKTTAITLVDIQGHDKDMATVDNQVEPGNYLDEIRKADCDIYLLVFAETLRHEQHGWITYIEQTLKRHCILVRSKVDIDFLSKFRERSGIFFGSSTAEQRAQYTSTIIEQLRFDNEIESHQVYLTAADYMPASSDAALLLKEQSFDMKSLFDEISRLAFDARNHRIHALGMRALARVMNICFRRGYVLNVFNYKIGAGFAAIVPFGDQLPRYLARDHIRHAFGLTKDFRQYLTQYHLTVDQGCLQTSTLENCVTATMMKSKSSKTSLGAAVGGAFMAGAPFSDDIFRAAAPAAVAITGGARIALTASTAVVGVVISAAVCAWSAVDSGKHIFGYVNRLCDDLILVSSPLIATIIDLNTKKYEHNL
ncbi:unnamed protein product [Rotaria socialis]|uniref:G domain-containing protein n=1 Tax=Rotaria socialis TaxID=392032 RepID=A0A821B2M1_9BILA|nr:unnamed protein product [Rotaria socialis]CAF4586624.1 unnamed protein product [Rotaria socialis]